MIDTPTTGSAATTPVTVTSHTLEVPGATLYYELRGTGPLVALIGSPMDARSFAPLADLLATDHTVLTADPRGVHRSTVDDPHAESTPQQRADDLARILAHIDAGPAAVLGSSGGAVTALALAAAHAVRAHTVIAHEPPVIDLLDDRDELRAGQEQMVALHQSGDYAGAWRQFLAQANIDLPEPVFQAMFGGERDPEQAADEHFGFVHEMPATTAWRPDLETLRSSGTHIVVGIGEDSTGQLCDRASRALAGSLGVQPVLFPGDHTGFAEDPESFAAHLRPYLTRP